MAFGAWLAAFLLTLLIEGALLLAVLGPGRRQVAAVLIANLVTHPAGYWLVVARGEPFALVEAGIVLLEVLVHRRALRVPWPDAVGISALCNGATILLSLLR